MSTEKLLTEQERILIARGAWQRAKWFEEKAAEAVEVAVRAHKQERQDTEKKLNVYLAALEQSAATIRDNQGPVVVAEAEVKNHD
jgi:hypothetical protein